MSGHFQFKPGLAMRRNLPNLVMIATCAVLTVKKFPITKMSTKKATKADTLQPRSPIISPIVPSSANNGQRPDSQGAGRCLNRGRSLDASHLDTLENLRTLERQLLSA